MEKFLSEGRRESHTTLKEWAQRGDDGVAILREEK